MYYDYQKVLSYNALLSFIIGERGVGKTYGAKKFCIKNYINKNDEFVYLRRYKTEFQGHELTVNGSKVIEKSLIAKTSKIISLKYTPDIYVKYNNLDIWIEVKSIENDVFYIKKKLFIKLLSEEFTKSGKKAMYFEVHSIAQLKQAIKIWKEYDRNYS